MATAIKSGANRLAHDNYTATAAPQTRTMGSDSVFAVVSNRATDPADAIAVSFDGGVNFFTIDAGSSFNFDVWGLQSYSVKALGADAAVECLYGQEG